jgi:hypothetical protein
VMVVGKWMRLSGPIPCAVRSCRFFAPILCSRRSSEEA